MKFRESVVVISYYQAQDPWRRMKKMKVFFIHIRTLYLGEIDFDHMRVYPLVDVNH